jgi:hypothetical protein
MSTSVDTNDTHAPVVSQGLSLDTSELLTLASDSESAEALLITKRYQVFISSTFADLQDERQKVMQAVMEIDCIPAGMELFPALDEEQFTFIKRVIDDSDYYLLIVGGRYGSISPQGISYTEAEYDYAVSKGIKVIALVHGDPQSIPIGKSEVSAEAREKLESFRNKVSQGRLVRFWKSAGELPMLVTASLAKTMSLYPAKGWIRGDAAASTDILNQLNDLRRENADLLKQISGLEREKVNKSAMVQGIAGGSSAIAVYGTVTRNSNRRETWTKELTWDQIFSLIGPLLLTPLNQGAVAFKLGERIVGSRGTPQVNEVLTETIGIQLSVLGLVKVYSATTTQNTHAVFWQLTERGTAYLANLRVIRKAPEPDAISPPNQGSSDQQGPET